MMKCFRRTSLFAGMRRKVLLPGFLSMAVALLLAGCGAKSNKDYAPVVCEALRQYEHWQGFRLTDGRVLLLYDGDHEGLPDSFGICPVQYVDSSVFLNVPDGCWPNVYEVQLVFEDAEHFDVLVYHHSVTRTSGGVIWGIWPYRPSLPMARGVWSPNGWTIETPLDVLRGRQRPQACNGMTDSVVITSIYEVHEAGTWDFVRDTTTLTGIRLWPCITDSLALEEARRSELYLCLKLHDTLLVVSNLPGIKSYNEWARMLIVSEIKAFFPTDYEVDEPLPVHEHSEGDCCCGPDYAKVYGCGDSAFFEGDSIFSLLALRFVSGNVDFAGLRVGMSLDSAAVLMALPAMDYSGYQCVVVVNPLQLEKAWYGLTQHKYNQSPNPGLFFEGPLVLEVQQGHVSQIRFGLDRFCRGQWRILARGFNDLY